MEINFLRKLLIVIPLVIFLLVMALLFLSIMFSIPIVFEEFSKILHPFTLNSFSSFVSPMVTLIELALFDIVLFILANGIYVSMIKPIIMTEPRAFELKVEDMFKNFVKLLSRPFLMAIASILIVFIFEIVIELDRAIKDRLSSKEINFDSYFYLNLIIVVIILIAIITIHILMRIEESISEEKVTKQNNESE